ncbi:hypothetical protein FZ934_04275 [Rhizobium grahamii]|uniref:HNH nuclease domain-containing protein n=1 Tax=Rhizobium grahamii TaxID=1120045 RepID=A0A5Q0C1G7_9HYPH|nr:MULTISPECIES: hypothetical protein [Rhizobium]QFY59716.1 hypothetical protein FZ934_04275 [Rhizobium grahamii]QRM51171.1 hypothetical protein F3Y33_18615 [Rhizobium sp. BG6]
MRLKKSRSEKIAIKWAVALKDPWGVDASSSALKSDSRAKAISSFKIRLKKYHLLLQDSRCGYCRVSLHNRNIETDREHILPKERFKFLCFDIYNLSVACKTCNMSIKKRRVTHLTSKGVLLHKDILDERNYKIVHPNIHVWSEHIDLQGDEDGDSVFRLYYPITDRGKFTYDFFKLKDLERARNNDAQRILPRGRTRKGDHPDIIAAAKATGQARR